MSFLFDLFKEEKNTPVGILGCGISGQSVYAFLSEAFPSMRFILRDRNPKALTFAGVREHTVFVRKSEDAWLEDINEKILIRSPGIRPDLPALCKARENGTRILSETALFCDLCPADIYAVTGSDGKTTTVSMASAMLRRAGAGQGFSVYLGGNIGQSLLPVLPAMTPKDKAVLELSSFQLADLSPTVHAAALLNITENHLNWHTTMEEYATAKRHLLDGAAHRTLYADNRAAADMMQPGDCLFSADRSPDALCAKYGEHPCVYLRDGMVRLREDGLDRVLFDTAFLRQSGKPFLLDAMAAAALVRHTADRCAIETALFDFTGVPHRMTYLGKKDGVHVYDSGADTTPARTCATLSALPCCDTVLCGGSDKGLSYAPLAKALADRSVLAVLFGQTSPAIALALEQQGVSFIKTETLQEAVDCALAHTKAGGTLLFSPACASFDAFTDYKARSRAFHDLIFKER